MSGTKVYEIKVNVFGSGEDETTDAQLLSELERKILDMNSQIGQRYITVVSIEEK